MHADWARKYVERFSFAIVPLPPATKAPGHSAWNADENLLRTVEQVNRHYERRPNDGMGVCLEPSGLVSIDPDFLEGSRTVLLREGVDLDRLISDTPTILGRAPRLMFRAPQGSSLSRKAIVWPARSPDHKPITVIEFRAGRVQDVLPPSIHPVTQKPYIWQTAPDQGFPELPSALLCLWVGFDSFARRARNLCPWAKPEPEPLPKRTSVTRLRPGPSVIAAFNESHDVTAILEQHGYKKAGNRRFKSPDGKNMAGVVVLNTGKAFCHHMSDSLGDGHAHDAFDLYARFEHAGNVRAAVKAAANLLGMDRKESA